MLYMGAGGHGAPPLNPLYVDRDGGSAQTLQSSDPLPQVMNPLPPRRGLGTQGSRRAVGVLEACRTGSVRRIDGCPGGVIGH